MKQNSRSIVCEEIPTVFLATQTLMCLRMSWDFWPFLLLRQLKWDFTSDLTVFAYFDFLSFSNLIYLKYFLFKWKIGRRRRNLGRNLKQVVMGCSYLINSSISCELNLRHYRFLRWQQTKQFLMYVSPTLWNSFRMKEARQRPIGDKIYVGSTIFWFKVPERSLLIYIVFWRLFF